MERIIDGRILIDTYDSIAEYAASAQANAKPGTKITPRTLDLVRSGWDIGISETLELAAHAVEASYEITEHSTFSPHWDVSGAEVDVARYLGNEPECMIDFPMQITISAGRTVTLVSSSDANAGLGSGGYLARGQAATALALALSRLGYSAELWTDNFGGDNYRQKGSECEVYQRILVKGANDTLDPAHLMYAYGHGSMLSQLAFGTFDGFPGIWGRTHSGDSRGCAWDERPAWVRGLYPPGTIFITGGSEVTDAEEMSAYVMAQLRELGILAE